MAPLTPVSPVEEPGPPGLVVVVCAPASNPLALPPSSIAAKINEIGLEDFMHRSIVSVRGRAPPCGSARIPPPERRRQRLIACTASPIVLSLTILRRVS